MILNSPYISGSLTVTGNITACGGISISGSIASASYAVNASYLNNSGSGEFVPTGSFNTFSSSILTYTGSVNSQLSALQVTSGSNITRIAALEVASGSAITRLNALEVTSGSNISRISSLETASGSAITRLSSLESASGSAITRLSSLESKTGSYATTGSNTFVAAQYISQSSNPTGFTTTASLYTDGGLRVTRDAYISGTLYLNNVTVYGTQSVAYITSSQLNIASNLITVNTATPSVQFGGLAVYDSGSSGLTGSILWDSTNNRWIYSNPSGSTYDGGMLISGPRNSSGLGNEVGTTACMLMAGQGGDHITSSMIYHSTTATCIPNTLAGGVGCFSGAVCAASVASTGTITGTTIYGSTAICGGSVTGTCAVFSGNGLFGGSTNAGNAGTNTLSVGVPGTTAGGLQLWAGTAQSSYVQFGDGTASADNYRGYIAYKHGTDTLVLGTVSTDQVAISSTGIACFASTVCAANIISSGAICTTGDGKNLDIGGVAVIRGNGGACTTHYFTTGAANVAKYLQYNATGTAINVIAADAVSYFNSGCTLLIGTTNTDIGGSVTGVGITANGRVLASISDTGALCHIFMGDRRGTSNEGPVLMLMRGGFFKSAIGVAGTAGTSNDGGITFSTVCGNDTIVERMRLTSAGQLCTGYIDAICGTSRFCRINQVAGSNTLMQQIQGAGTGYTYAYWGNNCGALIYGVDWSTGGALGTNSLAYSSGIYTATATALHLGTNQVVGLTIDCNNRIGIGTTSPSNRLDVCGGSSQVSSFIKYINGDGINTSFVNLCSNGYSSYIYIGSAPGTDWKLGKNVLNTGSCTYFQIVDSSGNLRLQINSSNGNVGLGTASPSYALHTGGRGYFFATNQDAGWGMLTLDYGNGTNSNIYAIQMAEGGAVNAALGFGSYGSPSNCGDLVMWTNDGSSLTERMRLYGNGASKVTMGSINTATLQQNYNTGPGGCINVCFDIYNAIPGKGSGYIMQVDIFVGGYGSAGASGLLYRASVAGYDGHYVGLGSYHQYSEQVKCAAGVDIKLYNPPGCQCLLGVTIYNCNGTYTHTGTMRMVITY